MGGVAASWGAAGLMASPLGGPAVPGCSGSGGVISGVGRSSGARGRLDESSQAAASRANPTTESEQRMAFLESWFIPRQDKRCSATESIWQNRELEQFGKRM